MKWKLIGPKIGMDIPNISVTLNNIFRTIREAIEFAFIAANNAVDDCHRPCKGFLAAKNNKTCIWEVFFIVHQELSEKEQVFKENLIDIAIEGWRFGKLVERMMGKLDAGETERYVNQHRWFIKKIGEALERAGLLIVNHEGCPYDPGYAASPLNLEDFEPEEQLVVDQMIEPVIMDDAGVVRTGTMMLRRL